MHFEDFCHHIREMIQVYILWMLHYMLVKICFAMVFISLDLSSTVLYNPKRIALIDLHILCSSSIR
jgi:hypothetical protein